MKYHIIFDGGAKSPAGQHPQCYGSFQVSVIGAHGHPFRCPPVRNNYPLLETSSQAECHTALEAVRWIRKHSKIPSKECDLELIGDSQLAVYGLCNRWKIKNPALKLIQSAFLIEADYFRSFYLEWHPRKKSVAVLGH
jgi:ribonuclease HI